MKFSHISDCHLGGWRQQELNDLNFQHFQKAVEISIKRNVDFILIAGDLFDSAYPSIDTLKQTFQEFRKLKDSNIPCFIIAGSHDYSASGKTFLDVLEKAGFCVNVSNFEEKGKKIILQPTLYENVAIYGYPGKKSGLEVDEIARISLQDAPGLFKILLLHTTIKSAVPNPNVKSVDESKLPPVNYIALGHLHITYNKGGVVYAGALFPNNLSELEELQCGSFYIFDNGKIEKQTIKIKEVLSITYQTKNTLKSTEEILSLLKSINISDKIVILKVVGLIEQGKTTDIDFTKIEAYTMEKGAYSFLKNTSKLKLLEPDLKIDFINREDLERRIIEKFEATSPSKFNSFIYSLLKTLQMEKAEEEKSAVFEERLLSEIKRIIEI